MNNIVLLIFSCLIICAAITAADDVFESESVEVQKRIIRDAKRKPNGNGCKEPNCGKNRKSSRSCRARKTGKACKETGKGCAWKNKKCVSSGRRKGNRGRGRKVTARQTFDATCVATAAITIRRWKEKAVNFVRQYKQMKNQQTQGDSKSKKKGNFGPIANKLINVGGGNKSAMMCSGKADNEGAKQLRNLTDLMEGCEKMINDSCNLANFPEANMTALDACKAKVDEFDVETKTCFGQIKNEATAIQGCQCFISDKIKGLLTEVEACDAETAFKNAKEANKKCRDAFTSCKKYEDDAVDILSACSSDVSKLSETAKLLSMNSNAVKKAQEKVKALTGSTSTRAKRAVATTCMELITKVKQCEYPMMINTLESIFLYFSGCHG